VCTAFLCSAQIEPERIRELEVTKVCTVLPAVRQGRANLEDALDDAKTLSRSDLREKHRDPAAKKGDDQSGRPDQSGPDPPPFFDAESDFTPPPLNPTDDVPRWASDGDGDGEAELLAVRVDELRDLLDGAQRVLAGARRRDRLIEFAESVEAALGAALDGGQR
jgi:hypothetical protein